LLKVIHSTAEAEELMSLGILVSGTRTQVLNHLTAHLIWFKQLSAPDAAEFLTQWTMNPRHVSKDIAHDLTHGTSIVRRHIETMCRWYESRKKASNAKESYEETGFATAEIEALRPSLAGLSSEGKTQQAHFLLHFLRFAKRHGVPDKHGNGWDAAPAVRQVIRRWTECHHMKYKSRLTHAISEGIMTNVKGAWHHGKGPGRARTYRLSVPVVPQAQWVLNYEAALDYLTGNNSQVHSEIISTAEGIADKEDSHANDSDRPDARDPNDANPGMLPSPLHPSCPGKRMDLGSRQCDSKSDEASGLHCRDPQGV
jgi:hypothetical protein